MNEAEKGYAMRYTIGCDIMNASRADWSGMASDDPFVRKTYSPSEWRYAQSSDEKAHVLAMGFAAKEAVYKSLHLDDAGVFRAESSLGRRLSFADIWITHDKAWPEVELAPDLMDYLGLAGISLTLSYEGNLIYATALAEWLCGKTASMAPVD